MLLSSISLTKSLHLAVRAKRQNYLKIKAQSYLDYSLLHKEVKQMFDIDISTFADALDIFYYILVYGIGVLAMAFCISAYQFRHRATIIIFNCFGQICWVLHFVLQGDLTSAIACALSAIMLAVFSKKGKWVWVASTITVITSIVILSGFSFLSFKVWYDVFPILAGAFAVIANSRTSEKRLRQFSILWCLFWVMNSVMKGYPVALANDLLCTGSAIVSLVRYRSKNVENERNQEPCEESN